ncbi:hypothetical protein [Streptomyces lancefieldiae]|uniref:Uncharacterized protein n=1 Tax=Streptomyces lancefieldiae TaxID=3075520 RepID=A0ABU3B216_9ACTN|nr:hypothetical protein [Streptomyces sp. DSM 40712]MDT0616494.1 hypothetical protein [Streptomyces sp. DSM 40712]
MPVARYALQYAAQLAALLGPQWRAASADSSTFAVLEGPGVEFDVRTTAPVRAHTPVTVSTRPRGNLVWSRRSDYRGEASGVIGAPGSVADEIRSHILPAWQELVTELEARTARTQAAIRHFAPLAAEITGATVSYGSRPGVADIRWEGGHAVLWASDEGLISSPSIEITRARGAATVFAVLHSAAGTARRLSIGDIGEAAALLLGDGWSATSSPWGVAAHIAHRDTPGAGYTLAVAEGHLYVSADLVGESRTYLNDVSDADELEVLGACVCAVVRRFHNDS